MFWLIETQDQIEYLINKQYKEAFIEIVPYHNILQMNYSLKRKNN